MPLRIFIMLAIGLGIVGYMAIKVREENSARRAVARGSAERLAIAKKELEASRAADKKARQARTKTTTAASQPAVPSALAVKMRDALRAALTAENPNATFRAEDLDAMLKALLQIKASRGALEGVKDTPQHQAEAARLADAARSAAADFEKRAGVSTATLLAGLSADDPVRPLLTP